MNARLSDDALLNWRQIAAVMFAVGAVVASSPAVAAAAPEAEVESSTTTDSDSDAATKPESDEADTESEAEAEPEDEAAEDDADSDTTEDVADDEDDKAEIEAQVEEPEPEVTSKRRFREESETSTESQTSTESETPTTSEESEESDSDVEAAESEDGDEAVAEPAAADINTSAQLAVTTTADDTETVSTSKPVTTKTIVTDVLTWVGLGEVSDDVPLPALPVPKLFELMWLAVRQTQHSFNNQRPVAQPTLSAQGDDGVVRGDLNATDFDDETLTYVVSAPAKFGTVVVDANGAFTYTPTPGVAATTDSFTVTIDDVQGNQPRLHGLAELFGQTGPTTATVTVDLAGGTEITDTAVTRPGAVTVQMGTDGKISVIGGTFTQTKVFDKADAAALLNSYASLLDAETGFATADSITVHKAGGSGVTQEYYRLRQSVDGIEVIGSDVILVTDGNGTVTGLVNYNDSRINDVDTTPVLGGGSTVAALAAAHLFSSTGARPSRTVTRLLTSDIDDPELVILATDDDQTPSLAWRVELPVATYYIRANGDNAGEVISATSTAQPATTVARDLLGVDREINVEAAKWWYLFDSEGLTDVTRNIETYATGYTLFGFGTPYLPGIISTRSLIFGWNAGGVSAHANMAEVYDYYADVLGRDSFDGEGATVVTSVGFNPRTTLIQYFFGYTNANWDAAGQQFLFGNTGGFEGALDIVAHEFTHGVISHIVGDGGSVLDHGESGALNEAYSDILGNLIEGKTGSGRWLIGEDTGVGAVRSMANPTAISNYRATWATRYTGTEDDGGEHWNSTIFSHAAYKMMTDPDTAGVSDATWAKVFYNSLETLEDGATFKDGRAAILLAAEPLLTASERQAVADAFDAVGIVGPATTLSGPDALALVAL